jgi:toxin HigB-1
MPWAHADRDLAHNNAPRYHCIVIRSFRDRDTQRLFDRQPVRKLGADLQRVALRKLRQLDAAVGLADLRAPPGNRLEKLTRDRAGQHSIRINDQWRVCFRWVGSDAHEVEIVDYH